MTFRMYYKGGGEILKQMAAPRINALVDEVGGNAGEDAVVFTYTTDRAAAMVAVPAGQQAKDGRLTRAFSAAGLEVRSK